MTEPEQQLARAEETVWVLRARRGDEQAFQSLVDLYDRRLLYFIGRFERDPSRISDVVQEVWVAVWRRLGKLDNPEAFRTWLYRIAHSQVVTAIRNELRHNELHRSFQEAIAPPRGGAYSTLADSELVHLALTRISADHREVLTLRFLESMTLVEISQVLDCQLGTVKSRMYYAKQAFRQAVEELDND